LSAICLTLMLMIQLGHQEEQTGAVAGDGIWDMAFGMVRE